MSKQYKEITHIYIGGLIVQRLTLQTLNLASWVQIPVRPLVPSGTDSMVSGKFIFYYFLSHLNCSIYILQVYYVN